MADYDFRNGNRWEDLRKQARQLENEIDLKLVSFSKLGTSYASGDRQNSNTNFGDKSPLLPTTQSQQPNRPNDYMFETMSMEIQQLLTKLTHINDALGEGSGGALHTSSAFQHTLQRHRDILQDYSHEFQKVQTNIRAHRDRDDLLGSVRRDIADYKNASGLNRRTELYLKEHEHARNSDKLLDEQISVAISTKENLQTQRQFFKQIQTRMNNMTSRLPLINSLMQRINIRKKKDSIVIGIVIAICLILIIIYLFH